MMTKETRRPRQIAVLGAVSLAAVAYPGIAWADGSGSTAVLPTNLWIAPLVGGSAAVATLLIATLVSVSWKAPGWLSAIQAMSAWDVQDSWVTNTTAVGGALTGVFSATALSSFFKDVNTDGFTVVSLMFGGAAVMGPVIYGAFSKRPTPEASSPTGSRIGLLLASLATLFSAFGLMADIGLLVSYTIGTGTEKTLVYVALSVASVVIGVYAIRSVKNMVNPPKADPQGFFAASMMSPARRTSGTL